MKQSVFAIVAIFSFCVGALFFKNVQAAELIMVEQQACEWCEAWDEDVGIVYSKTTEGKAAPLRRINIHDPLPDDIKFISGLVYTPTFVLIDKGEEIGRIRGYPGEAFFWGLLEQFIGKLGKQRGTGS